ncbi:MAG: hypothetical protein ABR508_09235 [Candidatus Baltobacteraceae bacterium]
MKRVLFFVAAVLFGAALLCTAAPAFAKDLDARPEGLLPATVPISQILNAYDAAAGKRPPGVQDTSSEEWTFTRAGLAGTEKLVRSGFDYYAHITSGPLSDEYGQFLGHGWHRDQNGVVSPAGSHDQNSFDMLLFMNALNDASDPKNDVTLLGQTADSRPAYVLAVKQTGQKHSEYVYYDKQSGLIQKVSHVSDGTRITIAYDDYRKTKGLSQPWHVHAGDGTPSLDFDFKRSSLKVGGDLDAMQFTMPASSFAFESFSGHQKLPAKVFWDQWTIDVGNGYEHDAESPTLVVRLNIGGRGLDFAVSAAEPDTLIDFDVAQQLQLPSYGQVTHAEGKDVPYDTILPAADLGGLMLRKLAVRATPFHYHLNDETKVVGVLGYDVLSTGVFKIDYDNSTLDVFPAQDFDNPALGGDAYSIPVLFDSGYPFFQGTLDSHISANILFDNDFEMSYVFGGFTGKYPESVKDVVTGKDHGMATIPFADSKGYGKDVHVWLGKVPDVQFGPAHFLNYQIVAADGDIEFGGHPVDAVMGGDLLRYYDIYLDYPHNRIFLKPNADFFKAFKVKQ